RDTMDGTDRSTGSTRRGPRREVSAMSTTGDTSWADAGLVPPAEVDVPDAARPAVPGSGPAADPDDHRPDPPRPDLRDEADEPDVVDQALEAGADPEDYPET
ncbi:MAG TPA: hypothetical protein VN257_06640, partial [Actinotalea sp.]|nr:hypothetical protein [Actinotalea sp.]